MRGVVEVPEIIGRHERKRKTMTPFLEFTLPGTSLAAAKNTKKINVVTSSSSSRIIQVQSSLRLVRCTAAS